MTWKTVLGVGAVLAFIGLVDYVIPGPILEEWLEFSQVAIAMAAIAWEGAQ